MADTKIADLTSGAPALAADIIPIARSAALTRSLTLTHVLTLGKTAYQDGGTHELSLVGLTGLLGTPQTPATHATSHQNAGTDEINVAGLNGLLADAQNPTLHAVNHELSGSDELDLTGLSGLLATNQNPTPHATNHQNSGSDEIVVTGLSGLLADPQNPTAHATNHQNSGTDEINVAGLSGLLADPQQVNIHKNGTLVGTRKNLNLIEGSNVTLTIADDGVDDEVDVTIAATGVGGYTNEEAQDAVGTILVDSSTIDFTYDDAVPSITATVIAVPTHKTSHENAGSDEINVTGLSGLLADDQNPTAHATDHQNGGGDEISVAGLSGLLADAQKVEIHKNGTLVGTRKAINLIEGSNVTLTVADDSGDDEVDVTIASTGGGSSSPYYRLTPPFSYNTSSGETTVLTIPIAAGDLSTNKSLRLIMGGNILGNNGSPTVTLRVKFGSTTMWADATPTMGAMLTRRVWSLTLIMTNQGSASSQVVTGLFSVSNAAAPAATGLGDIGATALLNCIIRGVAAENSGSALNFVITNQFSVSHASIEFVVEHAIAEVL